jgi:hypothetical protein
MTLSMPYPKPTTREQARKNAIHAAESANMEIAMGAQQSVGLGYAEVAKAWAMIADSFPYDTETIEVRSDDGSVTLYGPETSDPEQTIVVEDPTTAIMPVIGSVAHVIPSGHVPHLSGRIEVNSLVWDVLRVLAARYVRSSLSKRVSIDMTGDDLTTGDYDLVLRMDSTVVIAEPTKP